MKDFSLENSFKYAIVQISNQVNGDINITLSKKEILVRNQILKNKKFNNCTYYKRDINEQKKVPHLIS